MEMNSFFEIIARFLGGWDNLMNALAVLMAVKCATAVMLAVLERKPGGLISLRNLFKGLTLLLLVGASNTIDTLIIIKGINLRTAAILYYISVTGAALLKNASLLGLPVSRKLEKFFVSLK